ncbi:MAG: polymerase subunit sigma [Glaciihabitans sp.]|nr:polymerase subunit sigma [Glaciihabitans sp.]
MNAITHPPTAQPPTAQPPTATIAEIEAHLLARVAAGDRAAFAELYDRMMPRVLGIVIRVLRDVAQSEEVAQDVLLEIWQLAGRFDPERGSAAGWMLRKAHSRAIDRVRSAQSSFERDSRIGIRDLNEHQDAVEDIVETRIESERVVRALAVLPQAQREAVTLAHLNGYSHREVAELLHIPVGTVKTRIHAGIGRLRAELSIA